MLQKINASSKNLILYIQYVREVATRFPVRGVIWDFWLLRALFPQGYEKFRWASIKMVKFCGLGVKSELE